jgi:polyhydroxybutyrate depolymerase
VRVSSDRDGGGHTWPDGPQYLSKPVVGPVSHQFNASDVIWQFFSGFTQTVT